MPTNKQLLHYVATGDTDDYSEVDIRKISIVLLEDTLSGLLDTDNEHGIDYLALEKEFDLHDCPFDAISNFGIDIEPELKQIDELVIKIIASIDYHLKITRSCVPNTLDFAEMWKVDPSHALREILRGVGHGTSFWWHHEPEDLGLEDMPDIDDFESPYEEVQRILDKIVAHIQRQLA